MAVLWSSPRLQLASDFAPDSDWAINALDDWREKSELGKTLEASNEQVLKGVSVEYDDTGREGNNDPDIRIVLAGDMKEEHREELKDVLAEAFNVEAGSKESDVEPPDSLREGVADQQRDYWDQIDDAERFRQAERLIDFSQTETEGTGEIDEDTVSELSELLDNDDPKTIWAVADHKAGKDLLLGTDWYGAIDFSDEETMARFNAYTAEKPRAQATA